MQEKLDEQDKELNKFYEENKTQIKKNNQSTLPPELLAKFESIKNDMLTNSENKWYILLLFLFYIGTILNIKYKEYVPWKEHINQVK